MCLEVGRVDHHLGGLTTAFCQFHKDAPEHAELAPADEAVVDCLVWPGSVAQIG